MPLKVRGPVIMNRRVLNVCNVCNQSRINISVGQDTQNLNKIDKLCEDLMCIGKSIKKGRQ